MENPYEYELRVRALLGDRMNFQIDEKHGGLPRHADATVKGLEVDGRRFADHVRVSETGELLGGETNIGPKSLKW